ncbi:MAG: hypothetical protein KIS95_03410 [Anaerolineae bacterium]|nr:hypothetical protein [Anaerolineae bacterium]
MVSRSFHSGDPSRLPSNAEQLRPVREAVAVLQRLLKLLYNEPPSLDIITVGNILDRYPLTGLGAPAMAAIEQSQRIVRARGNYQQVGLAEFHIGLIYLYWNDCRAAANQFALARQPWSLASDAPAMCLAHYAQGLGLYHSYHNEPAMLQFGRAERLLNRSSIGAQAGRFAALDKEMRPLLSIAQETLRESLWPKEQQPAEVLQAGYLSVPADVAARAPQPEAESEVSSVYQRASERPEWVKRVPLPISNLPGAGDAARGPVPGHVTTDDRFGWYRIAVKKSEFLPALASGTWLLADRDVDERPSAGREYVVVGSRRADLGSIAVQPVSHTSAMPHCFLGYRMPDEAAPSHSRLVLDESEQPPAAGDVIVLAVVEGFWYGLNGHALPEPV